MTRTDRQLQQALAAAANGDVDRAVRVLRGLVRAIPRDALLRFHLGTVLAEAGAPEGLVQLREAVRLDPDDDAMRNNLGHALREAGQLEEAAMVFTALCDRAPRMAAAHYGLGTVALKQGRLVEADRSLAEACRLDPRQLMALRLRADVLEALDRHPEALEVLTVAMTLAPRHAPTVRKVGLLHAFIGRRAVAIATLRQALSLAPDDALAAHILGALTGEGPDRPDDAYVVELFDAFADSFDRHLVDVLHYRVPEMVAAALPGPLGCVADLGCGTGLLAPLLGPRATVLHGVDLSPAMVAKARARGGYDALTTGSIEAWLDGAEPVWDTIVLADVLVYVGSLERLWRGLRGAMGPGARVAATTEWHEGEGMVLRANGRYAHSTAAVDAACAAAGLLVRSRERVTLRKEGGRWVDGELVVMTVSS